MKKVLLIDDDKNLLEVTADLLRLADYTVLTANNGRIGVELAKQELPDVIVCDIMMPEIDGYGVLHMVGLNPATSGIPFILMSAKSDHEEMRRGMALGADDYLFKPYDRMELLAAIQGRIKRSSVLKHENAYAREGACHLMEHVHEVAALSSLRDESQLRAYRSKEYIYYQGDEPRHLYYLASGKVRRFITNSDGKELTLSLIRPGDYFGQDPIMEHTNYPGHAETMAESRVYLIPRSAFEQLLDHESEVGNLFMKLTTLELHAQQQKSISLAYDSVRKRTADALISLADTYGNGERNGFKVLISRLDLASIIGSSHESVTRTLGEFKRDGLVKVDSHSDILILDYQGLEQIR